jgi:hypothetical protein
MKIESKGTIVKKFDMYTKGDFKKVELVIETGDGDHKNPLKVAAMNDRVDFVEKLNEGDTVEFSAFVTGNEWNDKYFINLNLAYIKKTEGAVAKANIDSDLPF